MMITAGALSLTLSFQNSSNAEPKGKKGLTLNKLTSEEEQVILRKGTERPNSGKYLNNKAEGTYTCKQCDAKLYSSSDKFDSHCGWPSFDDEIPGAIKRIADADGSRIEITCARCDAHLGHVFEGERLTDKNIRHCVNSISMNFIPASSEVSATTTTKTAYFAGGCFWGTEHLLNKLDGVVSTRVGYMGGQTSNPTYEDICYKATGHAEAVEVVYDPGKTDFETVARHFFEIHDPTQADRQGPDIGDQYRSVIFYVDDEQKATSQKLIGILRDKKYDVVTELVKADTFWEAEKYHQDYYDQNGKQPYCHAYVKRF